MCNAFNHPWDCTCGWGGDGHMGRRGPGGTFVRTIRRTWETAESYVNPNGSCPKCNQQVFICQSPDGRRVLLDELGPPWPRHACSDLSHPPKLPLAKAPVTQVRYSWQRAGWNPFIVESIASISPELIRIGGIAGKSDMDLYLAKRQFGTLGDLREEIQRSAVQIRENLDERFRLSALLPPARVVEVDAFISSIEASNSVTALRSTGRRSPAARTRIR